MKLQVNDPIKLGSRRTPADPINYLCMTAPCPSYGFVVTIAFAPECDEGTRSAFSDAWIELLEAHGLYCAGGGGDSQEYVMASEATQATDADRRAVQAWLAERRELTRWEVGQLIDLTQAV